MFGILLAAASSAFGELSSSLGKKEVRDKAESYYTFGFLSLLFGAVFMAVVGFLRDSMVFSMESLPTFIPRAILEILQVHITILAIVKADRSDFGLIRTLTIPFLLLVDIALGYVITTKQLFGITFIFIAVAMLLSVEHLRVKGLWLLIVSSLNAVATISLYKYNITHFNSVEAEQSLISLIVMIYLFFCAMLIYKEDPFRFMRKPIFIVQMATSGLASIIVSYAYLFAPATIITTATRSFSVFFSLLSGKIYFKDSNIGAKAFIFSLIIVGLILLI